MLVGRDLITNKQVVHPGVQVSERVGQEENPDGDEKATADDGDDSHVALYFLESGKEGAKSQGREKERDSQAKGVGSQEEDAGREFLGCARIDQNRREDGANARRPSGGEDN